MYVEGELQAGEKASRPRAEAVSRHGEPIGEEQLERERQESREAGEELLKLITNGPMQSMVMSAGDVASWCRGSLETQPRWRWIAESSTGAPPTCPKRSVHC